MAKKTKTASEPILSSAAVPARTRKHAPAKHNTTPAVESSPSTDINALAAAVAVTTSSNPVVTESPTLDEIAALAYSYWEARGYQGGSPEEDWLHAEQELRNKLVSSARA
jgi:hypothetical protein